MADKVAELAVITADGRRVVYRKVEWSGPEDLVRFWRVIENHVLWRPGYEPDLLQAIGDEMVRVLGGRIEIDQPSPRRLVPDCPPSPACLRLTRFGSRKPPTRRCGPA